MTQDRQIKYGVVLSYAYVAVNVLSGIVFTPFLIHSLGQSQYGLYEIIVSLASNISILNFGLGGSVVKYVSTYRGEGDKEKQEIVIGTIIKLLSLFSLIAMIVCTVIYLNFDGIYSSSLTLAERNQGKYLFILASINLILSLPGGTFSNVLCAYEKFALTRGMEICKIILRMVLIFALSFFYISASTVLVIDTVLNLGIIAISYIWMRYKLKLEINWVNNDKKMLKDIFVFSGYTLFFVIAKEVQFQTDKTIIGLRLSTTMVTVYAAGSKISATFNQLGYILSGMYLPRAIAIENDNPSEKKYRTYIVGMGRIIFPIIMIVFVGYVFLGLPFMRLWMGIDYDLAFYSSVIMMASLLVPILLDTGLAILKAKDKQGVIAISWLISSILNIVLTWNAVPYWGLIGASLMTFVTSYVINVVVLLITLKKNTGLNLISTFYGICRGYGLSLILSIIYFSIIYYVLKLQINTWLMLIGVGIGYIIICLGTVFHGYVSEEQRKRIKDLVRKKLEK